ncbi:hypothetical protein HYH38_16185 [Clostridium botulinum]|uniref:FtsX-like family permease n=1 Tax=Clostridium botulinum TaxID=1491 RepID=A0A126JIW8_CLOBO|nr:FtsX-like permease family protein [Clostridium botulinum]ALT05444.1 permease, FtsX-like family [Clostridium botulinum]ALT05542.1 permease, FtsX-like family [Clostridium botulinum]ALT05638.1 FtsX-like family permease [Clostridium botulinum]ALT05738.1 FtsX-like family permease [Clostridium botulinum]ALT05840.1 FtsX-like family permease [Clostridium botulinum]
MKVKLFKIINNYWILFTIFFCISFFSMVVFTGILNMSTTINGKSSIFSNDAIKLSIDSINEKIYLNDIIKIITENKYDFVQIELHNKYNDEFEVSAIYMGNDSEIKFPINNGSTFKESDFINNEKVALVKQEVYEQLKKDNNYSFFEYCGEKYKVVGILDSKENKYLDDVYININSILDNKNITQDASYYKIICDSGEHTKNNIEKVISKYSNLKFTSDKLVKGDKAFINSINTNRVFIKSLFLLILVAIITIINITSYWINNEKQEFGIHKLIGGSNRDVQILLIKRFSTVLFIAMLLGCFGFETLKYRGVLKFFMIGESSIGMDILGFLGVLFSSIILGILVLIIPILKISALQINDIIKGECI